jgi:hypothetical protein
MVRLDTLYRAARKVVGDDDLGRDGPTGLSQG